MTSSTKYIGMDVHKVSISIAVRNAAGKVVMECVIETKASMTVVVCDPRRNALLQDGNQNDRVDARKLSDLLYMNKLSTVYHGDHGLRTLKELGRSYLTVTKDQSRVMSRIKAIYRSWAIPCSGKQVYGSRHRAEWLGKIPEPGVHRRAEFYYQQLDALRVLRQEVRRDLLVESKKHKIWKRLCEIPSIGPIRAAELLSILQTPHRFRTKRQLWTYCGLGVVTSSSADHELENGQLRRRKKRVETRGLNENCNHDLKNLLKGAAVVASLQPGPFAEFYAALLAKGMRPEMARLTLARKIATIVLIVWKKGVSFDVQHLKPQTA